MSGMNSVVDTVADHLTDIAAIGAIGYVAVSVSEPSTVVVGALTSIALGKRYMAQG